MVFFVCELCFGNGLFMGLRRKLLLWMTLLLMLLLAGNLVVSIVNAKSYYIKQMSALSEDTATSLGLTISQSAQAKDVAQVEAMINVIFDRGYYLSITYNDLAGKVLVSRARKIVIEHVPAWFIRMVEIPSPSGSSEVISGWFRLGELHVVSHPGYAYQELWGSFVNQLWLFLFGIVFAYGILGVSVRRMLEPLSMLERQANAVCREEFILIDNHPSAPEFSRLVDANNRMVGKIQSLFRGQIELTEILRRESYTDSLTGLPNRDEFDAQVSSYIEANRLEGGCALILCSIRTLTAVNLLRGREAGDEWVRSVAQILESVLVSWPTSIIGRRNGADFGVFIPGLMSEDIPMFMSNLTEQIEQLNLSLDQNQEPCRHPIQFGVALSAGGVRVDDLLVTADQAMRIAQLNDTYYDVQSAGDSMKQMRAASEWLPILENALEHQTIEFMFQRQFPLLPEESVNMTADKIVESLPVYEAFSRLRIGGDLIVAGIFWPFVERFRLEETMDRLIVNRILELLRSQEKLSLSVNVSLLAASQQEFREWLSSALSQYPKSISRRLTLEFPESVLCKSIVQFRELVPIIKAAGVNICISRFGLMPSSIGYLQELAIDSVKIDRRFACGIHQHQANRFYVKMLIQIAHSFSLEILADGVEQDEDRAILQAMGINGVQGYLLSEPQTLESLNI